jgi:hypothetical protein
MLITFPLAALLSHEQRLLVRRCHTWLPRALSFCANLVSSSPPFLPSVKSITHPSPPSRNRWLFSVLNIHMGFLCVVCSLQHRPSPLFGTLMFSILPPSSALSETPTRFCASRLIVPNLYGQVFSAFPSHVPSLYAVPVHSDGWAPCNFLPQTLDLPPPLSVEPP